SVTAAAPAAVDTPCLVVAAPEGPLPKSLAALDQGAGGALARLYAAGDFTGRKDEVAVLYPAGRAGRIVLIGLGKAEDVSRARLRRAAAIGAKRARMLGAPSAAFHLAPEGRGSVPPREVGQVLAEGLGQGAWIYTEMKRPPEDPRPRLEQVTILAPADTAEVEAGHAVGAAIAAGQAYTRGLQVLPGNVCTPTYLGERARELAAKYGFKVTVLDKAQVIKEGMGALMAIAQGSAEEPRFIALEYDGAKGKPVVLIGKGVTFDTGGISIKPAQNMEDMKFDMSGAAAVLGTFEALGRIKPKARVVGLIPSAENMPSGTAVKPGDVVKSHLGKTIEVINTDAEGRLLLADALSYARRYDPAVVLDAATLTGAIVIALGHTALGIMGNDDRVVEEVRQAGERAGERGWPLPLWDDYRDLMKSDIADVKNSGGRPAGSITAGWFLREFVEGFPWAHLDIAGTAYTDREDAAMAKGPTGIGVRLFTEFVLGRVA
ncbi:MAG TPA: leucyl aminopeptidase, partial [Gemmatimonadales bacterium]|nr:leucyl aminopeptidase [Gemmatimonadales bacterium]